MRIASVALTIAAIALTVGLLARQPDRASADYNIAGKWDVTSHGVTCSYMIQQFYETETSSTLVVTHNCHPDYPFYGVGAINLNDGTFGILGTIYTSTVTMDGTVSADNHSMSGTIVEDTACCGDIHGTFTGTGGSGNPKPASPTPTPTATATSTPLPPTPTPRPVAGIAFDTSAGGAFDAWWLIATAGAAFVTLGGAALCARRRG